jgi:hypothetical protein
MTTTTPSAALIPVAPVFTNTERLALAGFLAGYSGLTREVPGAGRASASVALRGPKVPGRAGHWALARNR